MEKSKPEKNTLTFSTTTTKVNKKTLKDSGDILDDKAKVKIEKTQENLPNAEIKENLNKVKTEFDSNKVIQEEKEEKKKKGKYIKKADRFQEQEEFSKSVSGLGSFALGLIITRLPNPIALTEEEATEFNKHFEKVAFKYSNFLGEYQSEAALLSVAALIVFPRLKKIKKAEIGNVDSNKKE